MKTLWINLFEGPYGGYYINPNGYRTKKEALAALHSQGRTKAIIKRYITTIKIKF